MIERPIVVTLYGHPAPKGSMKCIGERGKVKHQLVEDERPGQKPWRASITKTVREGVRQRADQYQALGVEVTLTVARSASHFGSGRNAGRLNARAPQYPTKQNTNDADKMLRLLLDALEDSGAFPNDAQVVEAVTRKAYPLATAEQLSGPTPPPWAASYRAHPDVLPGPGARFRIYPYTDDD